MKIIVTGSEGNIGSKLVPYLNTMGHEVICVDIKQKFRKNYIISDITNPLDLLYNLKDFKPDVIIHLAAMVSRITSEKSPTMTINTNLSGLNNIINLCNLYDAKLIYFSTSEIYGNIGGTLHENRQDVNPNNLYGLTKYLGEKIVEFNVNYKNLKAITIRPFMIYDEDETFGENRSAMIRFVEGIMKNQKIFVHKNSLRSWLHISDAVTIIEKTIYLNDYHIINIANIDIIKTETLALKICNALNKDYNNLCVEINQPQQMTLHKIPDTSNMIKLLNYFPKINVDTGISLLINKVKQRLNYE